jgi:hypothetical protein
MTITPQDKFNQWIQETAKLDISTKEGYHALGEALTELNHITREAWEMNQ